MKLSIVIPAYNEADNIGETIKELTKIIHDLDDPPASYEIIVVDDSSSDQTFEAIQALDNTNVRIIRLSRRSGSHIALRAGLDAAHGNAAICLAADGQDNPQALNAMISQWKAGHDIVWGLRKNRQNEPLLNNLFANLFYRLLSWFGETSSPDIDLSRADFYLLDRKVVNAIKSCQERNTSLFGLIVWLGFSQTFVEYDRRERRAGTTKWNFKGRLQLAKDWILAFSGLPLKLMTVVGFCIAGIGFIYAVFVIVNSVIFGSPLQGWASVMTAILLLGGGQIMMLGIIGEYLWRTLDESRDRPTYFIEKDTHDQITVPTLSRRRMDSN
ncbi:MAG: glycosyltransferase family 2 protein [Proteobacteria bacterium]|nr:glycosyltransferase family 2 protein [Pseudomonadota bacterium]MBU1716405.1 glycosyltransferase family 2 protein [Pseudomonadota bacterium]